MHDLIYNLYLFFLGLYIFNSFWNHFLVELYIIESGILLSWLHGLILYIAWQHGFV